MSNVLRPCTAMTRDQAELYSRLPDTLTYVAQRWNEELLAPHGYARSDQSRVQQLIRELVAAGRLTRQTVHGKSGYHARRSDVPRPRRVTICKVL